ncbi:HalOD1 output domain-containing protein [Halobaculum sp. EA56]|uniref:HalOD1 output domain-containing protein n=1 Tax=Halobaculum sp. EA56 TaxID=3421648 RepID=UPI003EBF8372
MRDTDSTAEPLTGPTSPRIGDAAPRYATYDPTDGEVCVAVANAVGETLGRDPARMEPLATAVDPDALASLVGSDRPNAVATTEVTFEYLDHEVTVSSDGVIELDPLAR